MTSAIGDQAPRSDGDYVLALVIALIAGFAVVLGLAVGTYLIAAMTLPVRQD